MASGAVAAGKVKAHGSRWRLSCVRHPRTVEKRLGNGAQPPHFLVGSVASTGDNLIRCRLVQFKLLFFEGGIGVHALTTTRINDDRQFGTAFQFGEIVGAGVAFGAHGEYEVEIFVQHESNGHIKPSANSGLTYSGLAFRIALP